MHIVAKANGRPRRVIDFQNLNKHCLRETHHCASPFKLASEVPPNTYKTILDAVDGYHAIMLDEESRHLTTFITQWGRYRYLRLPQGFLAAGDVYTRRYDEIIKDVSRKIKIIDDTLLFDNTIRDAFFHTWDYLVLCAEKGIVINKEKLKFCQRTIDFAGLTLTPSGVRPSDPMISAIKNFPTPHDISSARAWFGLINQVSWAYANHHDMLPFRNLVRPSTHFFWDKSMDDLFQRSKNNLISQVHEGVRCYDVSRVKCLQTDWSTEGIGYLLLQKHCSCDLSKAPVCCHNGWKLVFAGSRFLKDAETRYSPTEGEALAVSWSLDHARIYTLGCENLIVSTDHRPLVGILNDRNLESIHNTRINSLKEKTLRYHFKLQYNPGKWHRAADAFSRYPHSLKSSVNSRNEPVTISMIDSLMIFCEHCSAYPESTVEEQVKDVIDSKIHSLNSEDCWDDTTLLSLQSIKHATEKDDSFQLLIRTIFSGFPNTRHLTEPSIRDFWEVRDRLSATDNVITMDDRLVIPKLLRKQVLHALHSAHQGTNGMRARAQYSVYWPGLNNDIRNMRNNCKYCSEISPVSHANPLYLLLHQSTLSSTYVLTILT